MCIRVMHIIPSLNVGGIENALLTLVNHMNREKYEWEIICIGEGPISRQLKENNYHIIELKKKPKQAGLIVMIKLAMHIRRYQPDILHCHGFSASWRVGLIGVVIRKPAIVKAFHGMNMNRRRTLRIMDRLLTKKNDYYVVVSEARKKLMLSRREAEIHKITVISNGVEYDRFKRNGNKNNVRKEFNIPINVPVIGSVASLTPIKDHKSILEAVRIVAKKFPQAYFLFVGDGPLREELKSFATIIGVQNQVRFAGQRFDIPDLLDAMDIFVLCSISEDNSVAILEAMASKLPVIATRVGGNPEIVIENNTGFLVQPKDPLAISQKINIMLKDSALRREFGKNGRKIIEERFSIGKTVAKYENLYQRLAANSGK